jgi:hypothetical protein
MEEGDIPPVSSAPSSASGSDCTPISQPQSLQMAATDGGSGAGHLVDERLAMLQEVFIFRKYKLKNTRFIPIFFSFLPK